MTLQETIIAQLGVKPSIDPKEEMCIRDRCDSRTKWGGEINDDFHVDWFETTNAR